jgi:hypothetical protein
MRFLSSLLFKLQIPGAPVGCLARGGALLVHGGRISPGESWSTTLHGIELGGSLVWFV